VNSRRCEHGTPAPTGKCVGGHGPGVCAGNDAEARAAYRESKQAHSTHKGGLAVNFKSKPWNRRVLIVAALATAAVALTATVASADGDYGPDTCLNGYVWRGALPNDRVCVTPARRDTTARENTEGSQHRAGGGAYGPDTCVNGYVWRDAVANDHVCVLFASGSRDAARQDNASAASRRDDIRVWMGTWHPNPVHCDGDICTTNNDDAARYRVMSDRINTGQAYVKLARLNGTLIEGKWITVSANPNAPGGSFGYNSSQLLCTGSPNAYFRVYDGSSHRWSNKQYVTVGCATL
jgi:hypothetical protein